MEQFIDLRALARVRDMELVARAVANGFLHGLQASEQRGVGIEFSQYRSYEPGDAPARIDWKLFARSDRYFVREAERESEIDIWLVLDTSESMALKSESGVWTKFDYARYLIASLAYLALRQGDRVGLLAVCEQGPQLVRPLSGMRQWYRILHALKHAELSGRFPNADALTAELARLQRPGLVLLVTDLYQQSDEIEHFLTRISTARNETGVLQLECADERDFPFDGPVRFEDLETGEQVLTSARRARASYLSARDAWSSEMRARLGRLGVGLDRIDVDQPLDHGLFAFLERRRRGLMR